MIKTTENRARKQGVTITESQKFRLGQAESASFSYEALKQARLSAGFTQIEIAEVLHCKTDLIRMYERGDRTPIASNLVKLMIAYNVSAMDLTNIAEAPA